MPNTFVSRVIFGLFVCSLMLVGFPNLGMAENPCVTDPDSAGASPDGGACEGIGVWVYIGTTNSTHTFRIGKQDVAATHFEFKLQDFSMPPNVYCDHPKHSVPASGFKDYVCATPPYKALEAKVKWWESSGSSTTRSSYFLTY